MVFQGMDVQLFIYPASFGWAPRHLLQWTLDLD